MPEAPEALRTRVPLWVLKRRSEVVTGMDGREQAFTLLQ